MIHKGQVRWVNDDDVRQQNRFIDRLCDLAALLHRPVLLETSAVAVFNGCSTSFHIEQSPFSYHSLSSSYASDAVSKEVFTNFNVQLNQFGWRVAFLFILTPDSGTRLGQVETNCHCYP